MHSRNAHLIKDLGKKSLGGITDDLGDNCKIIKGYMLEYIKKGDPKPHYHLRGKGLNKDDKRSLDQVVRVLKKTISDIQAEG